jgi:hypothetical protein
MHPISILTVDLNLSKGSTEQKKGQTDRLTDGQMDGWTDGRTDRWADKNFNVWLDKCQVGQTSRLDKCQGRTNVTFLAFCQTNVRSDKCPVYV